jgi:hypothetical protein
MINMSYIKVSTLDTIAFGLNIEGGDPYRRLQHDCKDKPFIWANLILVLDRPLVDNVVFDEIWNDNRFPLLENRIDNLNEHHFMAAFLMIIQYYITHAHKLLNKKSNQNVKITIHLHQDPSRIPLCDIINKHLCMLMNVPNNIELEYLTDTPIYNKTTTNYAETDILISLSQCAGLSLEHIPGTLYVANKFIPYDVNTSMVNTLQKYRVVNDLVFRIGRMLKSEYNIKSVEYVNQNYKSNNPGKINNKAHVLTSNDFIDTTILQLDGLWNPKNKNELVLIN